MTMVSSNIMVCSAVLEALPEYGPIGSAVPVGKGHTSEGWLVDSANGFLLARIALRDSGGRRLANALSAVESARRVGVPVPEFLHFNLGDPTFQGHPFSISRFIPGQDGQDALRTMNVEGRARIFEEWGAMVGRLHQVEASVFSRDLLGTDPKANWGDFVDARLASVPMQYQEAGLSVSKETAEAIHRVRSGATALSSLVRPTFVHDDLYLENTVVANGRLRALLDFEHARLSEPASDFVKLELFVFDDYAEARESFFAGYARVRNLPDCLVFRVKVAIGFELVCTIAYFHRWQDDVAIATYREHLARWLDAM